MEGRQVSPSARSTIERSRPMLPRAGDAAPDGSRGLTTSRSGGDLDGDLPRSGDRIPRVAALPAPPLDGPRTAEAIRGGRSSPLARPGRPGRRQPVQDAPHCRSIDGASRRDEPSADVARPSARTGSETRRRRLHRLSARRPARLGGSPALHVGASGVTTPTSMNVVVGHGTKQPPYQERQGWRRRRESNPCTRLCRPLPKPLGHAAEGGSPYLAPASRPEPRSGHSRRQQALVHQTFV